MNPVIPRFFKRVSLALVVSAAFLYTSDYLWLRLRMAHPGAGAAFGVATVYDSTAMKNGEIELFYNQPQAQTCVRTLFPHLGYTPCWYLARSPVKQVGLTPPGSGAPNGVAPADYARDDFALAATRASSAAATMVSASNPAWFFLPRYAIMKTDEKENRKEPRRT